MKAKKDEATKYEYFVWAKQTLEEQRERFTTALFVNSFYAKKQAKYPASSNDKRKTCANDALRTLVELGVIKRIQNGVYKWTGEELRLSDKEAFYKAYTRMKTPKKEQEKQVKDNTETLTQLGNQNTKYVYQEPTAELLETFENVHPDQIHLVSFVQSRDEFTSLCPATGQPDQAKIEMIYVPNQRMVESKSFKLYLFSYRNHGAFHEDIVNTIVKDLWQLLTPKYLRVFGDFCPRGGIAIKPLVEKWADERGRQPDINQYITRLVDAWDKKKGGSF